mgnify:FL=1
MANMNPFDEYNTEDAAGKKKKDKKVASADFFGTPKNIRDANKRLSGPGPHSTQDKRDVLLYYNKKNKKGKV